MLFSLCTPFCPVEMATQKPLCTCLKDFKGSEEEEKVKCVLEIITTETASPTPAFVNLVIQNSNASDGTSFSDAYVSLRLSYESMEAFETDFRSGYPKSGVVYLKDILDIGVLEEFHKHGVDAITKCSRPDVCWKAFLALLEFLREKRKHEESIKKLVTIATHSTSGNKETQIMAGLAHHLFSQLVPGKKYEVDKYAKQLPKECGCGCKAKISEGDTTSVGSQRTWHGRVDIILNHTIAIAIGKKPTDDAEEGKGDDVDDNDDDDDDDVGEPQRKRRKVKPKLNSCDICVEVNSKATKKHDSVLLDLKVLKQIFAEAITNGFAQVNRNRSRLDFLIPTFGATSDHVSICLYDPENDCLLHIKEQLELWCSDELSDRLNVSTITMIWLFLNFTAFTQKKVATALDLDKSGFHENLKQHLEYYKRAETRKNFVSPTTVGPPWKNVYLQPKSRKNKV